MLPGATLAHKRDYWQFDSGLGTASTPSNHISRLATRLKAVAPQLRSLADHHDVLVVVAIYLRGAQGPETYLAPAVLRWLSDVGASIQFDLYATD